MEKVSYLPESPSFVDLCTLHQHAMRYYRLWIYACNTVLALATLIFILFALSVLVDPRLSLLTEVELYQPTFIYAYIALLLQCGVLQTIGCLGALRLNQKLLNTYWTLLFLLMIGDIIVGIFWAFRLDNIKSSLRPSLKLKLQTQYNLDADFTQTWDWVQANDMCCGVDSPYDYYFNDSFLNGDNSSWPILHSLPSSCCTFHKRSSSSSFDSSSSEEVGPDEDEPLLPPPPNLNKRHHSHSRTRSPRSSSSKTQKTPPPHSPPHTITSSSSSLFSDFETSLPPTSSFDSHKTPPPPTRRGGVNILFSDSSFVTNETPPPNRGGGSSNLLVNNETPPPKGGGASILSSSSKSPPPPSSFIKRGPSKRRGGSSMLYSDSSLVNIETPPPATKRRGGSYKLYSESSLVNSETPPPKRKRGGVLRNEEGFSPSSSALTRGRLKHLSSSALNNTKTERSGGRREGSKRGEIKGGLIGVCEIPLNLRSESYEYSDSSHSYSPSSTLLPPRHLSHKAIYGAYFHSLYHIEAHGEGCGERVVAWLDHVTEVLFVLGFCIIVFLKGCFLAILRYEIREMISKIRLLEGDESGRSGGESELIRLTSLYNSRSGEEIGGGEEVTGESIILNRNEEGGGGGGGGEEGGRVRREPSKKYVPQYPLNHVNEGGGTTKPPPKKGYPPFGNYLNSNNMMYRIQREQQEKETDEGSGAEEMESCGALLGGIRRSRSNSSGTSADRINRIKLVKLLPISIPIPIPGPRNGNNNISTTTQETTLNHQNSDNILSSS